jgi:oligoribonuclease NrnB/cAMP/cGMP phosphodiesterase (DHH superfamily)
MNECGATLAWKTLFPDEPMPAFLEYVRDRDLWNFELPATQDFNEALASMKYGLEKIGERARLFSLFDALAKLNREDLVGVGRAIGGPLLAPKREKIDAAAARVKIEVVAGYSVPVVRLNEDGSEDRLTSDVCMRLYADLYPEALFVACITSDGKTYSLRSNKHNPGGGFDVGALAKSQGGGGHHNASGFMLKGESCG